MVKQVVEQAAKKCRRVWTVRRTRVCARRVATVGVGETHQEQSIVESYKLCALVSSCGWSSSSAALQQQRDGYELDAGQ